MSYWLATDTRALSSLSRTVSMWYRRAIDTVQIQRDWFSDLHFYRWIAVLCQRIQTSRPCFCFLFLLLVLVDRYLLSAACFSTNFLSAQMSISCSPTSGLHLLPVDKSPYTRFGSQQRTQHGPSTSATSLRPRTHFTELTSSSNLCFQPYTHTHSPRSQLISTHLSRASVSSHWPRGLQPLSSALTELKPRPLALFPTFQVLRSYTLTHQCALDLHSLDAATWRGTTSDSTMFPGRQGGTAAGRFRDREA